MSKKSCRAGALFFGLFLTAVLAGNVLSARAAGSVPTGKYTSLEELTDKRLGVLTGSSFDQIIAEHFPDAEAVYYNSTSDLLAALRSNKIDSFAMDEPVVTYIMGESGDITYIPEYLEPFDYAYAFPKTESGEKLCGEFSDYLRELKAENKLEEKMEKWLSRNEEDWTLPDYKNFPAPNGVLVMVTDASSAPFTFFYGNDVVGYEADIAAEFCEAYGYGLRIEVVNADATLPYIQSGKGDFVGSAKTITEERAKSVLFSEPDYSGGVVMAVLSGSQESSGLLGGIAESFQKTFIRESRWKMFLEGIVNTLTITLSSILLGTLLGFLVYLLCRNGNRLANGITGICLWLVKGMPMVVMLMILYYIIFGKSSMSGMVVAIIGFTLTFGASVYGLLQTGVGAVDRGQYEAACALGYTDLQAFFKVILPQALTHVMSSYGGEIISHLKGTSIVGYIAVQDLTKMGDIVRSRTYEAFFPLIAVAVIYFILEFVLNFITGRIGHSLDPRRQTPEKIMKGVNTDDSH